MLRDRRIWWGTVAVFAGIGAALLTGSGTAAADTGGSPEHASAATSQSSDNSSSATVATGRHRVAPAAVVSRVRTPKPTATAAPTATATQQAGARRAALTPAKVLANVLSVFGVPGTTVAPAAPAAQTTGTSARPAAASSASAQSVVTPPATNGVTGVLEGPPAWRFRSAARPIPERPTGTSRPRPTAPCRPRA